MKVKSTDPVKAKVMQALKAKSGATKVTQVTKVNETTYSGQCFKKKPDSRKFDDLGTVEVTTEEVGA